MSESWVNISKRKENYVGSQEFESIENNEKSSQLLEIKEINPPKNPFINNISPTSRREETYYEKFKNIGINLRFNFEALGLNEWLVEEDRDKKSIVYLLGEKYEIDNDSKDKAQKFEEVRVRFSKIIWFSYRKNFPKLNHKKLPRTESYISDTGWGCMIRACQMMFAECLKRSYFTQQIRLHEENKQDFPEICQKELNKKILSWFLDSEVTPNLAPYSIQTLSNYIYDKFQTLPGVWLKPSMVLFALQKIHKKFCRDTFPDLDMEIYLEGTIYLSQAIKRMTSMRSLEDEKSNGNNESVFESDFEVIDEDEVQKISGKKLIKCSPKLKGIELRKSSSDGYNFESFLLDDSKDFEKLLRMKWKKSLIVYVLAKIGLEKPNDEYIPFIKEILSYPESVGMIGGKPGLAYYIVGYTKDKLIYLDPHFVQESVPSKEQLEENLNSYSCEKMRYVGFTEIDTSVAFGFFIQNETSFQEFIKRFKESCEKKESFLGLEMSIMKEDSGDFESFEDDEELEMVYE